MAPKVAPHVTHIRPRVINQDNVPFMLRDLATKIDRGEIPAPKTAFVVMLVPDDGIPIVEHFGEVGNRMEEVGALSLAAHWHMTDTDEDVDD